MEARWLRAVMSGLRWGEVLGLSWQGVNLDLGTARIRQALQYKPGTGLAGARELSMPLSRIAQSRVAQDQIHTD